MLPSSTVENYLKAIYLGGAQEHSHRLLPMGHLAAALGVAPGTATTMVKALAESGLVQYEPYAGVALTAAGAKLAALVVRRHRVIELFLVKVMGYRWDEVHDEAERAFLRVPPYIDDGVREVRILQARHCNQEVADQRVVGPGTHGARLPETPREE